MTRLATHQLPTARLRAALDRSGLDPLPDADLIDRFARYAEHAAFDVILRRHGPIVYGVCRRMLANAADAEDAFLVLVRKAGSLRRTDRLGPWLYGVVFKVAAKARTRSMRLATRQTEATDMIPDPTPEPPDWLPVLDAELNALPAKYREPLVLCELQGASRADAAKALGIPEGTLSSRLARGRDLLRRRLLKHGTLLPAGGLAALFSMCGIGRAAIPAGLLAKTSELAVATGTTATGTTPAGVVPAGPARLTDEVIKGMMLTKLRVGVGAILASVLVAFGVAAAIPGDPANQKEKPKASPATAAKGQATKPATSTPAAPDRDAIQGLWVLEKMDYGAGNKAQHTAEAKALVGQMRFLVAGDVWWGMIPGAGQGTSPMLAKLDTTKNPKWLDLTDIDARSNLTRCIYELDGDRLRICTADGGNSVRPAEFTPDGENVGVMEFRREKLPPAAGDKALVGSWAGEPSSVQQDINGPWEHLPAQRVEILDGYLFALVGGPDSEWLAGRYTVDATKNPKWIDVDLVSRDRDAKATKLFGCYEVADGQLKLALGLTGKRVTRPLELKAEKDVLFLDVKATKEPLAVIRKAARERAPAPRPEGLPAWDERVRRLMEARDYAEAEKTFRARIAESTGLLRATYQLWLGDCLLERARGSEAAEAATLRTEAEDLFRKAIERADKSEKEGGPDSKRAPALRTHAVIRGLKVLQQQQKPDDLLLAGTAFLGKHRGTVEELIVLSLMYHALKQKGEPGQALRMRDRMKELFDKLAIEPDAFPAKTGEFSRDYWEKEWFAEKK